MLSKFERRPVDSVDAVRRTCNVVVDGATFEERGGRFEWVSNAVELEVRHYSAAFLRRLLAVTPHVTSLVLRDVDAAPCEAQRCDDASAAPQEADRLTRCRLQSLTVYQRPFEASSTDTEKKHSENEDDERQAIEDAAVAAASAVLDCCEFRELAALSLSGTTFACTRAFLRAVPIESTSLGSGVVRSRASDLEVVLHRCKLMTGLVHQQGNMKVYALNGIFVLAWRSRRAALLAVPWTDLTSLPRLKVIIVGERNVGKTSLLQQLTNEWRRPPKATVGVGFTDVSFLNVATMNFVEMNYQSRSTIKSITMFACAVMAVAAVNDANSLQSAVQWKEQILRDCEPSKLQLRDPFHIPTFLVLNKDDLAMDSSVRESEYRAFSHRNGFDDMWLVSAKDPQRVHSMFQTIAQRLVALCEPVPHTNVRDAPPTPFIRSREIPPPPEKQDFFSLLKKQLN